MNIKIFYRSPVIWNIVLYIIFSFVFIYFQEIYKNASSVIEKGLFKNFVIEHQALVVLFSITIFSLFKNNRKIAILLYTSSVLVTFALTTYNLYLDFSKFSLIILFFYLLIAFYFYQFYSVDVSESYYTPQFDKNYLFTPMLKKIPIKIEKKEGELLEGYLTNWSEDGCFVFLNSEQQIKGSVKTVPRLALHWLLYSPASTYTLVQVGCPIQKSPGQSVFNNSPKLIAA